MPLDPNLAGLLAQLAAADGAPLQELTLDEARAQIQLMALLDGPAEDVAEVVDRTIPGPVGPIPVRVYRGVGTPDGPLPVLAWFHGVGFVIGDLQSAEPTARKLANRSGALVVSVDYRRAP